MADDPDQRVVDPGGQAAAEPAPVGPFQRPDDELLSYLRECFREAWDGKQQQVVKRTQDWKMFAGDQWEATDVAARKKLKLPTLTLNILLSIISAVEGEERSDRQELKFYGEGQEDDGAAYGLNRILKWIMDGCGGEFALSQAFKSDIVCGEGWVVPDVDFFDDPEGIIRLLYVDDEEMFDDPVARDPTSADSRYCNRVRYMTEDEGEARWPGFRDKVRQQGTAAGNVIGSDASGYRDIYSAPDDTKSIKVYDAKKRLWAVTETWWFQIEPGAVVVNEQTGLLEEKTPDEFEQLKTQRAEQQKQVMASVVAGQATFAAPPPPVLTPAGPMTPPALPTVQLPPPLQAQERPVKRFYSAFWCGTNLLDKQPSPLTDLKRVPYVPMRAMYDKVLGEWFGIVRSLIDAQRQHNVEQSAIVQWTQLQPKQSWMAPKGAFHNKQEWETNVAQPGKMLEYNASRGKPEQITTPALPRHMVDMAMSRPMAMREISGVNVEMTGQKQASDPGVVMEMRRKAAQTVLAPIFDNYRMSKKALGKVLLAYIQKYISPGRRLRVLGPEGPQYVEMTEQMQLGRYDVMVEETNSTINDRIATLNVLQTTLPQLAKAGMTVPPEVIDLLPMAPNVRDAWKRQMSWDLARSGALPPPNWRPGDPIPLPAPSPGMAPAQPGSPPPAPPAA